MITRRLFALLLVMLPATVAAQEGSVRYAHSVQFDLGSAQARAGGAGQRGAGGRGFARGRGDRSGGFTQRGGGAQNRQPPGSTGTVVLAFSGAESLMRTEVDDEQDESAPTSGRAARGGGEFFRRRLATQSRGATEVQLAAYANDTDGTFTETREFMGRTFLIRGSRPAYEWKLGGEQSEFLGYMVMKATAVQDSSTIEAWFTPQIPVSAGPGPYGGLPGLILVVSVDRGDELYSAIEVDLSGLEDGAIVALDDGDEVSREEYEKIVEDRLEELRTLRRRR